MPKKKNWRPPDWKKINPDPCEGCKYKRAGRIPCDLYCGEHRDYQSREAGADMMFKVVMKTRPTNEEIRIKLVSCTCGPMEVPELLNWLKDKLLVKE